MRMQHSVKDFCRERAPANNVWDTLPDCTLYIGRGAVGHMLSGLGRGLCVYDENTVKFAHIFSGCEHLVLEGDVHPDMERISQLQRAIGESGAEHIVAVGSGVINDLCKMASYNLAHPYICVATALSMNGYVSATASILSGGRKMSHKAHIPSILVMDDDILATAPAHMTQSGIWDARAYHNCLMDISFAHAQEGGRERLLNIMHAQRPVMERLDEDIDDMHALRDALIISGAAMSAHGTSEPASQSEHMLAHVLEAMGGEFSGLLHGQQVAICMGIMQRLMHALPHIPVGEFSHKPRVDAFCEMFPEETPRNINRSRKIPPIPQSIPRDPTGLKRPDITLNDAHILSALRVAPLTRERITYLDLFARLSDDVQKAVLNYEDGYSHI